MSLKKINLNNPYNTRLVIDFLAEIFNDDTVEYRVEVEIFLKENRNKEIYIYEVNNKAIGFTSVHSWDVFPKPGKSDRKYVQMANFYIKPNYRQETYGRKFLDALLKKFSAEKIEKVVVFAGGEFGEFFKKHDFIEDNNILLLKL